MSAVTIAKLHALTATDQERFVRYGWAPRQALPFTSLHRAVEAQVQAHGEAVAVEHQGQNITYSELDRQASRLATLLARHGVRAGDNVALFVERSIPMVIGIFATLKLGAAYVPQDARISPASQLRHVMHASRTRVVLTLSHLREKIPVSGDQICLALDEILRDVETEELATSAEVNETDRCFVLFTSGTTGYPNGVQVSHKNVCNILLTAPGDLGLRPGLRVGQILNIAFDMAAWEILGALTHGATLVIRGKDFTELAGQVDVLIATPSILRAIARERCRNVKVVAVAGEPCPRALAEEWSAGATFYNACGPTEVTIVNTMHRFDPALAKLSIGKPTPNNTVYVLDENLRPCPIEQVGEMWAGGDCVTLGYIGNEKLTRERYRDDPFLAGGRKMFRTRDLGRWNAYGELEHLGRIDDQVKIRGFRVELDSISTVLESVEGCTQAVTLKLDDRNLVSFVCPASVDVERARQRVQSALPYYCTPTRVVALDSLPITSRGKIDKRALTALAVDLAEREGSRVLEAAV